MKSLEVFVTARPVDHKRGLAIALFGGLALSFDIPMVRLTQGDMWSVQFLRSVVIVAVTLLGWMALRVVFNKRYELVPGKDGVVVLLLYGVTSVLFFYSVYATSTANLVFLLAFNPMFGALLGWQMLGERPRPQTFLAMLAMILGVFVIVAGGLSGGHILGDLSALAAALVMALAITISRRSGKDMGFAALLSAAVPAAAGSFFVAAQGGINAEAPGWIILNGAVLMPTAFYALALAPSFLPAATVGMFYLLETILAPVWVWMIFKETPSGQTLFGGGILLAALIAHSIWEMREDRRLKAAGGA